MMVLLPRMGGGNQQSATATVRHEVRRQSAVLHMARAWRELSLVWHLVSEDIDDCIDLTDVGLALDDIDVLRVACAREPEPVMEPDEEMDGVGVEGAMCVGQIAPGDEAGAHDATSSHKRSKHNV